MNVQHVRPWSQLCTRFDVREPHVASGSSHNRPLPQKAADHILMQVIQPHFMLSRRIFQQLTDSLLLGSPVRIACTSCIASRCPLPSSSRYPIGNPTRHSSSSTRWKSRQGRDFFAKEAKVQGLKSRAAFKLLEVLITLLRLFLSIAKQE